MANLDAPRGFHPVTGGQAGTTVQQHEYTAASNVTFYQGQIVALVSGVVNVVNSTRYNRILGSVQNHVAKAATDRTIYVADDPDQEFMVQLDSDGTLVTTDAGLRPDAKQYFVAVNISSGNNTLGLSIAELDSSSATTVNNSTSLAPFRGLRFSQEIENTQNVSWGDVIVKINPANHIYARTS